MKHSVTVACGAPEREEHRADGIDRAAEQDKPDERQRILTVFPKRIYQHKAHPAEHHIQHHLSHLEALLVNVCQRRTDRAYYYAKGDHYDRKRAVVRHNADKHQRNARALDEHIDNGMVDNSQHLLA